MNKARYMLKSMRLRTLIIIAILCCCIFGSLMIWCSYGTLLGKEPIALLVLGAVAIVAALRICLADCAKRVAC